MYLIVGLGNIGTEYANTRHNLGFNLVDKLIEKYNIQNFQNKFASHLYQGTIKENKVILIKPQTFMNRSGISVAEVKKFFKIPLENILVIHDDLDLDFCKLKFKIGGGAGGHNGLKSIDEMIGKNYWRLRIGIGRPEFKNDISNYVLKKYNSQELKTLENLNQELADSIELFFSEDKKNYQSELAVINGNFKVIG